MIILQATSVSVIFHDVTDRSVPRARFRPGESPMTPAFPPRISTSGLRTCVAPKDTILSILPL